MSSTSSNGFASFLILRGFKLVNPPSKEKGKHRFSFEIDQGEMDSLYVEYTKSEFPAFDAIGRKLRQELRKCTF